MYFYKMQTTLGVIGNMLTFLTCSGVELSFHSTLLTRLGVSLVTVTIVLAVSVCFLFLFFLQDANKVRYYWEYANAANV